MCQIQNMKTKFWEIKVHTQNAEEKEKKPLLKFA